MDLLVKRVIAFVVAITISFALISCTSVADEQASHELAEDKTESKVTSFEEIVMKYDKPIIFENEKIRVSIGEFGELLYAESVNNGNIYFTNDEAHSFLLKLDSSAESIWDADPINGQYETLTEKDATTTVCVSDDKVEIEATVLRENGTIVVRKTYVLSGEDIIINTSIENNLLVGVVGSIIPAYLSGVNGEENPASCLFPLKTGVLCENGEIPGGYLSGDGGMLLSESYPTPISMQLVTLFDKNKTVSYTVEDTSAEYKTFYYKLCKDQSSSVYCELMPFVACHETKELASIVISCFDTGNWTVASDRYATFLADVDWCKQGGEAANLFTGMNGWDLNIYKDKYRTKYVQDAAALTSETLKNSMMRIQRGTGMEYMWITGWHDGGFDTDYPDYTFSEALGGESGFAQGIQDIHELGGKAIVYLNAHMADIESEWYNTQGEIGVINGKTCAIKKIDGSVYHETYPTSGGAQDVAMCPCAEAFQKAIVDAVERVREAGCDGIYLDQVSEMRSYLCYDETHGHSTPATAYFEGYSVLLQNVVNVMEKYGSDYILMCEGICDVYGKWIDVFCAYTDTNFLPLTRYTIPNKIVGRDLASESENTYFASAFVMSEPFVCHRYHVSYNNNNLKRYIDLYEAYPDIYLKGRYVYHNGVMYNEVPGLEVGVIESDELNRSVVQLYNNDPNKKKQEVTLVFTPSVGQIVSAYNAETQEIFELVDGQLVLLLSPSQTISVIFEYE